MSTHATISSGSFKTAAEAVLAVCMMFYACKEKYVPDVKDVNPNYLVIDGFINVGGDSTIFKVSRTFKLEKKAVSSPEKGAIVAVEGEAGGSYILPELPTKPGTYAVSALNVDKAKRYRLRVRTKDNREYLSDFVESKESPQVELTHDYRHDNLNIYSNTHDDTGKSRYYSYSFTETWQYRPPQKSVLKADKASGRIVYRLLPEEDIWNCYHIVPSGKIVLATTSSLTEDRLSDNLIVDVLPNSRKVQIEYSVLVKQIVLTKEGFNFYDALRKNTESVGSIFDAQPSQLKGNIKCTTNADEVVIGFVSAGTVTEKRILLLANDMPFKFKGPLLDTYCELNKDTVDVAKQKALLFDPVPPLYIILDWFPPDRFGGAVTATTFFECVDCRLQGGTNKVPPYWIY